MAVELHGEVLDIRPGDTLLLTTSGPLSMDQEARMRDALEDQLPGVRVVIVGPVSGTVVYRPDQPVAADQPPALDELARASGLGG